MPYFGNNPSPLLLNTVAQNGKEMTLDADADTSITADTDDQIDIKIGGADDFQFTANTFTAQSGSTIATNTISETTSGSGVTIDSVLLKDGGIDVNGNEIILDADADTSITADTDDQIDIRISGADDFQFTANTFTSLSGSTIATDTISETTSGSGVTIDGVLLKDGGIDVNGNEIILDADADSSITADTDDQIDFRVGGADKMTLTSAGNLQIGSANDFSGGQDTLQIGDSQQFRLYHNGGGGNSVACILNTANSMQVFTDVIRFTSADNSESLFGADKDSAFFAKYNNLTTLQTTASGIIAYAQGSESSFTGQFQSLGTSNSSSNSLYLMHQTNHSDATSIFIQAAFYGSGTNYNRFLVYSNGATYNASNTYGNISDERLKSDITDAKSQWDDIKAIKVRNFKKYDTGDLIQLGVVAQEVEKVSPSLIEEVKPSEADASHNSDFGELVDDLDNPILYTVDDTLPNGKKVGDVKEYKKKVNVKEKVKAIKYSVLYMKAVKALQEAMERIETLEAKVKTLEEA